MYLYFFFIKDPRYIWDFNAKIQVFKLKYFYIKYLLNLHNDEDYNRQKR